MYRNLKQAAGNDPRIRKIGYDTVTVKFRMNFAG